MGRWVPRAALSAVVVLLLAGTLAAIGSAQASTPPTYTLTGYVEGPGSQPVPTGVTVNLTSSATQQSYTTTTSAGGAFSFVSAGASANAAGLGPGWWSVSVPPQKDVSLSGRPGVYSVFPSGAAASYGFYNASQLMSSVQHDISGVTVSEDNVTVNGTVSYQGKAYAGATVELLSPTLNDFIVQTNTTSAINNKTQGLHVGYYSFEAPWGNWVLETIIPTFPEYYNETTLDINAGSAPASGNLTRNVTVLTAKSYTISGYVDLASNHADRDPAGGLVTVYSASTGMIFNAPIAGGYYSFGVPGAGSYTVCVATVGYGTQCYLLTVSAANPTGSPASPQSSYVPQIATPANYTTTLNWSKGFYVLDVATNAKLANDSSIPQLANASIGQIWAQLALDWQHNLTFDQANFGTFSNWVNSTGPFFPAGQASTTVNNIGYGQPTNYTFSSASSCASFCGLNSPASVTFNWTQAYNLTSKLTTTNKSYALSFDFKHPVGNQAFNYTVVLPKGYVLSANPSVPQDTAVVPAGPGGTYTSFTLVSKPSTTSPPSPDGTFAFTAVKNGTVTASVNVTAKEFTWSAKNVLNDSRGNYTVIAEANESLTFTGLNSTFSQNINASAYDWNFGDGHYDNGTNATTNHTYTRPGEYLGSLTVTSSGNSASSVPFKMFIGNEAPTAVITVNDTKILHATNGVPYLIVNWSTALQFNASQSLSTVNAGANPPAGRISVAFWNITDSTSQTFNLTSASGADPLSNITTTFAGQGKYITQGTAAPGVPISASFFGWQYNVTLTVWDYGGLNSTTTMVILVKDTQKPTPVIVLKNGAGKLVPASGLVEGTNHTAFVSLWATNSTDPNNGSIVKYYWAITDSSNSSVKLNFTRTASAPSYPLPTGIGVWLAPQQKAYTVNLTVTDRAGNTNYVTQALTVAVNLSTRPILTVANLTAPATMTDGSTYTIWANVTNLGGANSTADNVSVRFYLLPPSGSGSEDVIGGSPGSVKFYQWTDNATPSSPNSTGSGTIPYNHTDKVEIQFDPGLTGTWDLWVNATASNEFVPDYTSGQNQAHVQVTLNQNPIVGLETDLAIVAAVVVVIGLIVFFFWRRGRARSGTGGKAGSSSSKLERGSKKDDDDD
jgi:PKD domain